MGSSSSKPVRSAANTVSRRQYPKQPTSPPTASPSATVQAQRSRAQPPPRPSREPQTSPQDQTIQSNEQASQVKSNGMLYPTWSCGARAQERSEQNNKRIKKNVTNQTKTNSHRHGRPRSPIRRLPPIHRPRDSRPDILPLEHLRPFRSSSHPAEPIPNPLPQCILQSIAPGGKCASADYRSRREGSRGVRATESWGTGVFGCVDDSSGYLDAR